jgi:hypothetical protein
METKNYLKNIDHLYPLISSHAKMAGNFDKDDHFAGYGEFLTFEEWESVSAFLDWLVENDLSFGSANFSERYQQFLAGQSNNEEATNV